MKSLLMTAGMVLLLIAGSTAAFAASGRCVVVKAEGNELILSCERTTEDFQEGQEVKIKAERQRGAAIEGC